MEKASDRFERGLKGLVQPTLATHLVSIDFQARDAQNFLIL